MDPNDQAAQPPDDHVNEAGAADPATRTSGFRRTVLTAGMAAALLIAGGVAAVSAASPDPSATPTPATTTEPSTDGSTAPAASADPGQGTRADCPHDDAADDSTSATPTPTPAS